MATKKEEIVVDVRSAVKLEQELQAHIEHGVVLIDVYSTEWGPCKALAETFRALNNDTGAKLRILSAECHSILASMKNPEERNHQRPKNMEAIRETLPEAWQSVFEERVGLSKPFFLIYKEGKRVGAIDGVNTPVIRSFVKELRMVRQPPENFLSGALLAAWKQYIHHDESEVSNERFLKGLLPMAEATESLTSEEKAVIFEALASKDSKVVTADNFSKWIGDDGTVAQAFNATLPDYHARAAKAKSERDAEEKLRHEKEADAAEKEAARKAKEEEEARASALSTADANIARWSQASGMSVDEAKDTPALRASRKALAVQVSDRVQFAASLNLLPAETGAEAAAEMANALSPSPTISQFLLSSGANVASVHNIRRAVEKRFPDANVLAAGKMASLCLTSTEDEMKTYFGASGLNVLASTLSGNVAAQFPAVALAAITQGASDATEEQVTLFYTAAADQIAGLDAAAVGSSVIIPPLSLFSTRGTKNVPEGNITVVLHGTRRAIFTASASVRPASAVALTAWYGAYEVLSKEGDKVELAFTGFAFDNVLDALSEGARKAQSDEDDMHMAISQLQRAIADKNLATGVAPEIFDEAVVVKKNPEPEADAGDAEQQGQEEL